LAKHVWILLLNPHKEAAIMQLSRLCSFGCAEIGPGRSWRFCRGFISELIGECSPRPPLAATQVTSGGPSPFLPSSLPTWVCGLLALLIASQPFRALATSFVRGGWFMHIVEYFTNALIPAFSSPHLINRVNGHLPFSRLPFGNRHGLFISRLPWRSDVFYLPL